MHLKNSRHRQNVGHQVCEKTDSRVVGNDTVVLRVVVDPNTRNTVNISDIIRNTPHISHG